MFREYTHQRHTTLFARGYFLTSDTVSLCGAISKAETLLIIGVLCIFSGAPWITGQIMPDVFSSVLLLTIFLIAFCTDQLRRGEVLYVSVLMTVAIATHFSPCADCLWFDFVVVRIEAHFWAEQGSHLAIGGAAPHAVRCSGMFHARGELGGFTRKSVLRGTATSSSWQMDRRRTCSGLLDACLPDYGQ